MAWIQLKKEKDVLSITVGGRWQATEVSGVDDDLRALDLSKINTCKFNAASIEAIDTAGVWLIERLLFSLETRKIKTSLTGIDKKLAGMMKVIEKTPIKLIPKEAVPNPFVMWVQKLGQDTISGSNTAVELLSFFGLVIVALWNSVRRPTRFRVVSIVSLLEKVGLNALPIVGMISFLIGMVLLYQSSFQLRKFGAEIYAVDLLAVSILREIGILLAAIMVAGRSGSAFTAQIGTMKFNQEIDAMLTFGIDPVEMLVLPRFIALLIAFPLLVFYADIMGLLGGAFMAVFAVDISYSQFLDQLNLAIGPWTFWTAMIKAPVFAIIIALVGSFEGMRVFGGAENVGKQTTRSVVESIFLIIVFDAGFSIMFTYIGI